MIDTGYFVATTFSGAILQNQSLCNGSIRQYIISADYAIYASTPQVDVTPVVQGALLDSWTSDISRFTTASFETMANAKALEGYPRSLGWLAIKIYYAAFFAAHALLRFSGLSLTYISPAERAAVRNVSATYLGTPCNLNNGVHSIRLTPAPATISIFVETEDSSHMPLWREFDAFLDQSISRITTLPTTVDTLNAIDDLTSLQTDLIKFGGSAALSSVRNNINYSQQFEVWFPYGSQSIEAVDVMRIVSQWTGKYIVGNALSSSRNRALVMMDLAARIVNLCRSTASAAQGVKTGTRSFLDRRALPFLNPLLAS